MVSVIPICLGAVLVGKGLTGLAIGVVGWLYWAHTQAKREHNSPAWQRERLRREYWGQL